jgi:hypothetical protein
LIQAQRDLVELRLRMDGQVGSSREVLPQQEICVFVGAALPGTLRITEVNLNIRRYREVFVLALDPRRPAVVAILADATRDRCSGSGLTANRINQPNASGLYPAFDRSSCSPRPALCYRPLLTLPQSFCNVEGDFAGVRIESTQREIAADLRGHVKLQTIVV